MSDLISEERIKLIEQIIGSTYVVTVTYVDGPFDARVIFGSGFACVQSYVRPV